jgi:hypothetical protein
VNGLLREKCQNSEQTIILQERGAEFRIIYIILSTGYIDIYKDRNI